MCLHYEDSLTIMYKLTDYSHFEQQCLVCFSIFCCHGILLHLALLLGDEPLMAFESVAQFLAKCSLTAHLYMDLKRILACCTLHSVLAWTVCWQWLSVISFHFCLNHVSVNIHFTLWSYYMLMPEYNFQVLSEITIIASHIHYSCGIVWPLFALHHKPAIALLSPIWHCFC